MPDFNKTLGDLQNQLESLAKLTFKEYKDEAFEDGKVFVNKIKVDLERLSNLLVNGEITAEEFEWLILSKKDLAEMILLKQKGLALVRVDQFKGSVLNLVIDSLLSKFLP